MGLEDRQCRRAPRHDGSPGLAQVQALETLLTQHHSSGFVRRMGDKSGVVRRHPAQMRASAVRRPMMMMRRGR
jgi:hypothetical protein